jgi:hypothetical protein
MPANKLSGVNLEYPVHDNDKYPSRISFEVIHSDPPRFSTNFESIANWTEEARDDKKPVGTVSNATIRASGKKVNLYIPQSHQVNETFSYDTPGLGLSGGALAAGLDAGGNITSAVGGAIDQGFKGLSDLIGAFRGEEIGRLAAVRAANFAPIPDNLKNAVSVSARTTVHPNMRTMFKQVNVREFTFQFNFIPRSQRESDEVKAIINFFRYYAYPEEIRAELDGNKNISVPVGYKYPDMFRIRLMTKSRDSGQWVHHGVNMIDTYLRSVSTNFNPTMAVYHSDGDPVEINFAVNFVEHRALARQDIQTPDWEQTQSETQQTERGYKFTPETATEDDIRSPF